MRAIRSQLSQVLAAAITIAAGIAVLVIAPNATAWAQDTAPWNTALSAEEYEPIATTDGWQENVADMTDLKTLYFGDDGTNTVLFKFVADEAGDLSAGTLYAAKATQNDDESFGLEWIELGKGNDDDIAEAIATLQLPE